MSLLTLDNLARIGQLKAEPRNEKEVNRADTAMPQTDNSPISIGTPHRALRMLEILVYDYDALGVATRILPAGAVFQPWEPLRHWRGERVPITLGDGAVQFDWGVTSPAGHFLRWDDFFQRCAPYDASHAKAAPRLEEQSIASPLAELAVIGGRLRRAANTSGNRAMIDDLLASLAAIHVAHTRAAEMQRGAEGFDNTGSAARYAATQARLLAEAQDILSAAKALLR